MSSHSSGPARTQLLSAKGCADRTIVSGTSYRLAQPHSDLGGGEVLIRRIVIECLGARLPGCHRYSGGVDDPPVGSPYPDPDFQPRNRHERPCRQLASSGLRARRSGNDCGNRRDHDFWTMARQYGRPPRAAAHDASLTHHHHDRVGTVSLARVLPSSRAVRDRRAVELPHLHHPASGPYGGCACVTTSRGIVTRFCDRGDLLHDRPYSCHHRSDDNRNPDHHHGMRVRCRHRSHRPDGPQSRNNRAF